MNRFPHTEDELAHLFFAAKAAAYVSPMTIMEWRKAGRSDFLVVDVRKREQRPERKIAGSLWFPQPEIGERLAELPKDKLIVVYCWHICCSLATWAALLLAERGYRVKELHGGIEAWETHHLPEVDMITGEPVAGLRQETAGQNAATEEDA